MLAYDQAAMLQPFHQLPDLASSYGLDAASALAALNLSAHSLDAQALLLGQHQQPADLGCPPGLNVQLPPGLGGPAASSSPLQFDPAAMADAAWQLQHPAASGASSPDQRGPRVFVPDSLKGAAGAALPGSSPPTQAQLLQQAAAGGFGGQQLDQSSGLVQSLLQDPLLLQQVLQQQAAVDALTAATAVPPGLGQQQLAGSLPGLAGNNWGGSTQGMQPTNLAEAAAAAAAAAALMVTQQHQQQQQQQVQAAVMKALAMLSGTTGAAGLSQPGFPGAAPLQVESWAANALARQQQAAGFGVAGAANPHHLASLLSGSTAGVAPMPRAGSLGAGPQSNRRRSGRRSSGTTANTMADLSAFSNVSRANSIAGSEAGADGKGGLPAVLPAGVTAKDLCPTRYEDTWASSSADETAAPASVSSSTDGSCQLVRGSSSASTSSMESNMAASLASGSTLSLSSSSGGDTKQGSAGAEAGDKWQWDSHFCSLDDGAASGSSGVAGRACRKAAKQQQQPLEPQQADADTKPSKDQTPAGSKTAAAAAAAGVWIPGQREAAGDDSWYLPRPPTCRLFVGNIGCWVDEAMLLAYFGKYGHVVDVQVMWNTKMLARGRRVNREFAFISYSSPLEAARAVHWLDGCRLPDLEKDKNGVTVEYENGEGEGPAGK